VAYHYCVPEHRLCDVHRILEDERKLGRNREPRARPARRKVAVLHEAKHEAMDIDANVLQKCDLVTRVEGRQLTTVLRIKKQTAAARSVRLSVAVERRATRTKTVAPNIKVEKPVAAVSGPYTK
jgi:hypothetical protein